MSEDLIQVEAEELSSQESAPPRPIQAVDSGSSSEAAPADDETADPMDAVARAIDGDAGMVGDDLMGVSNIHTGANRQDGRAGPSLLDPGAVQADATSLTRGQAENNESGPQTDTPVRGADDTAGGRPDEGANDGEEAFVPGQTTPPAAAPAAAAPAATGAAAEAPEPAAQAAAPAGAGGGGGGGGGQGGEEVAADAVTDAADPATPEAPTTETTTTTATTTEPAAEPVVVLPPELEVTAASGDEDTGIPLDVSAVLGSDSGVLTVTISGLPAGSVLSAGTLNADGSWTLTVDQLDGLLLYPPANSDVDFSLTVTATTVSNGQTVTTTAVLPVTVNAVADAPELTASVAPGTEDTAVALNISSALTDRDGSESLTITITGVPAGATLSAGTLNPDGSWTLSADQLGGLTLTPGLHSDTDFTLTVTATSTEAANGDTASTVVTIPVSLEAVADAPILSLSTPGGKEDTAIPLTISSSLVDTDGSESLTLVLSGIPDGATLSAGTKNGDGTWTLTADQVNGLTMTPPVNYSGTISITVTATATESANGSTASTTASLDVVVAPVADAPTVTVSNIVVDEATGHGAQAISLNNITIGLTDTDGSEAIGSITISGVPSGWALNAGTNNGDGSWTLTQAQLTGLTITPPADYSVNSDGGTPPTLTIAVQSVEQADKSQVATTTQTFTITVNPTADAPDADAENVADVEGATIKLDLSAIETDQHGPAETLAVSITGVPSGFQLVDSTGAAWDPAGIPATELDNVFIRPEPGNTTAENFSGTVPLSLVVTSQDGTSVSDPVEVPFTVTWTPVADSPSLTLSNVVVDEVAGHGAQVIALDNIGVALTDTDGSESISSVTIAGVPAGWALNQGTDNGDGSWTLSQAQLSGLTITAPADYAVNSDGGVAPTLTVSAVSAESDGGTTATSLGSFTITVNPTADTPDATAEDVGGVEGATVKLDLSAVQTDQLGPAETLALSITGLPSGFQLVDGDGAVITAGNIPADGLDDVYIQPIPGNVAAENFSGTIPLTLVVTSQDGSSVSAPVSVPFDVTLTAVVDDPTLTVSDVVVAEKTGHGTQTYVLNNISAGLYDTDGSEVIHSVTISGVPDGWSLNHGTDNGDGSWTMSKADLSGLTISTPGDYSVLSEAGSVAPTLTVTVLSEEGSAPGVYGTASDTFTFTVTPTADTPDITASAPTGLEGVATKLTLTAVQTDTNGPAETLTMAVTGVPALFELVDGDGNVVGTSNGSGTWDLTGVDLNNVYLAPVDGKLAEDYSGKINLTFQVTSTDGASSTSTSTPLTVHLLGDADVPTLSLTSTGGTEDQFIALNIAGASTDIDGSETMSYSVDFGDSWAGKTLTFKINGVDTTKTLDSEGKVALTSSQVPGLQFKAPGNWSGTETVEVTATATDYGGDKESVTQSVTFNVTADADDATLTASNATGTERENPTDAGIPLTVRVRLADSDGSESINSITIKGVPDGWTLNMGTANGDGSYSFTAADLNSSGYISGLTITPPVDYSNLDNANKAVTLTLEAVTREGSNGDLESNSRNFTVSVTPVSDVADTAAGNVSGDEGHAIKLDLSVTETDVYSATGSVNETLSVQITGVPDGFELVNGAGAVVGSRGASGWTVTSGKEDAVNGVLDNLYIRPVAGNVTTDFGDGDINLTMVVTSQDGSATAVTSQQDFTVHYVGVADTPEMEVRDAVGVEDTAIALDIRPTETDQDGSEVITVRIDDIPEGAILSVGGTAVFTASSGSTSFVLTAEQLSGLTITPPSDSNDDFTLTITAISTESGSGDSTEGAPQTIDVTVKGDADTPVVVLPLASGTEDQVGGVPLNLHDVVVLGDDDTVNATQSETISAVISGLPRGFTLSEGQINADGSWSLTTTQMSTVRLIAPEDYSGSVTLTVKAIATERYEDGDTAGTGDIASKTFTMDVDITPVVDDDPGFSDVTGKEDTFIALDPTPHSADGDGSESWTQVTLTGIPAGATLRYTDGDGNLVTQTFTTGSDSITLTKAQTTGLAIQPPDDSNQDFSLALTTTMVDTATAHDGSIMTDTREVSGTLNVNVVGVADVPVVVAEDASGTTRTLPVEISGTLGDIDGSEHAHYIVSGVPQGVVFSDGYNNGDGTWTLTADQLSGLTAKLPASTDSLTMQVQMVVTENDGDTNLDDAPVTDSFTLTVTGGSGGGGSGGSGGGGSDPGDLALGSVATNEDTAAGIGSQLADKFADVDTASVTLTGIPAGSVIAGSYTDNGDGSITVAKADLSGLTVTPPAHSGDDFSLGVAWTEDGAGKSATLAVDVAPVPDAPSVTVSDSGGVEDQSVTVTVDLSQIDRDGSESVFLVIDDLPEGASLVGGIQNANGSWTLPVDREALDQSVDVTITPPANFSGALEFTVGGIAMEEETGEYVRTDHAIAVQIEARADEASIAATGSTVEEDTAASLNLSIGVTDVGETIAQVVIGGLPSGFTLTDGTTDADGGYVAVGTAVAGGVDVTGLDYGSLMVVPRENYSGSVNLSISVTTQDGSDTQVTTSNVGVTFIADPDQATISATDVVGSEDSAVALNLTAALVDTDGSEIMAVTVSNLPTGGMLSAGTNNGDGSWTLTAAQLPGLKFLPPEDLSGEVTLTLSATTLERSTGERVTISQDFTVDLTPVADTPDIDVKTDTYATTEDVPVTLSLTAASGDASEAVTVVFSNVPDGGSFSKGAAGSEPGTWEISGADLAGLTFTPPANADSGAGSYDLTVTVVSTESDGSSASVSDTLSISVTPVTDGATLDIADVVVDEAAGHAPQVIDLNITPQLTDSDGSEAISSVTITGVPTGWALNHGTQSGGTWTLSASDLTGLQVTVPADYAVNSETGSVAPTLTVTVNAYETSNPTDAVATSDSFTVTVNPTADAAAAAAADVAGDEGSAVRLDLSALETDQHGPAESLSVSISGLPAGFELVDGAGNVVGSDGAGGWNVPADALGDLWLRPETGNEDANDYSGSMALTLSVTTQDGVSVSDPVMAEFDVTFTPVADMPDISVEDATGQAGMEIPLDLTAVATDDSEVLSIMVTVPDKATLSAGDQDGNDWTLAPDHLPGLTMTLAEDTPPGDYDVTMTVTSTDGADTAVASETLTVTVTEEIVEPMATSDLGDGGGEVPDVGGEEAYSDPAMFADALDGSGDSGGSGGLDGTDGSDGGAGAGDSGGVGDSFSMGDGGGSTPAEQSGGGGEETAAAAA